MSTNEPSISFLIGNPKCEYKVSDKISTRKCTNTHTQNRPVPTTYFANSKIYSERTPQRQPQELGEICLSVFDD